MAKLTEDHQLLLAKQSSGTRYRQILGELRHRGIDAERQAEMWIEIQDVVAQSVVDNPPSTIKKLLSRK